MADFSMFGPEQSGGRLQERDTQEAMVRAAQLEGAQTGNRLQKAQAGKLEGEAAVSKKLAEAMSGMPQSESMADSIEQMSRLALQAGSPAQAAKYATQAAQIRAQEATEMRQGALLDKAQTEQQIKMLTAASALYDGVQDQAGFDRANANYARLFGAPAPLTGRQYNPGLVAGLQQFGTTQAQRLKAQLDTLEAESRNANRQSAVDFRSFRRGVLTGDAELRRQREERLAKVGGGKGIAAPTTAERKLAESLIGAEFPDLAERGDELGPAAYAVASRAKALQRANRALDSDAAVRQAFAAEKESGNFQSVDGAYKTLGYPRKGTKYAQPEPLPSDRAKLVAGKRYVTPRGVVKWDGKVATLVSGASDKSIGAALPDDEPDQDEDD